MKNEKITRTLETEEDDLHSEIYSTRLLVFLETHPQSNKYNQVLLQPEEFKRVALSLGQLVEQTGKTQTVELNSSDEIYTLPDLQEINFSPKQK